MAEKVVKKEEKSQVPIIQQKEEKRDYFFVEKPKKEPTPKPKKPKEEKNNDKECQRLIKKAGRYSDKRFKMGYNDLGKVIVAKIKKDDRYLELTVKAFDLYMKAGGMTKDQSLTWNAYGEAAELYLGILGFLDKGAVLKTRRTELKELYEKAKNPEEAAKTCLLIASRGGYTTRMCQEAGKQYEKAGKYAEAAEAYAKGNEFDKAGKIYEKIGDLVCAAEIYVKTPENYSDAARVYGKLGENAKAAQLYDEAGDPENAALFYEKAGMLENAALQYFHAADVDGIEPLENYRKAGEIFEKLLKKGNAALCYGKMAGLCEGKLKEGYLEKAKRLSLEARVSRTETEFVEYRDFTPKMKRELEAVEYGGEKYKQYMKSRVEGQFDKGTHAAVNLDGCFYYRESDQDPAFPVSLEMRKKLGLGGHVPEQVISVRDAQHMIYYGTLNRVPIPYFDASFIVKTDGKGMNPRLFSELHNYVELNSDKIVSQYEMNALYQLNLAGRYAGAGKGVYFALKHFPGGDMFVEATHETAYTYPDSLSELKKGFARPFADAIRNPDFTVTDILVGWQRYPNAAKELREKYSFPSIWPDDVSLPSGIDPYMVRGLLRKEFGFEGRTFGDAEWMEGLEKFVDANKSKLPKELRGFRLETITIISEIYAGVEPYYAIINSGYDMLAARDEIKKLYDSNQEFHNVFDEFALSALITRLKKVPIEERPELPYDVTGMSVVDINSPKNDQAVVGKLKDWLGNSFEKGLTVILGDTSYMHTDGTGYVKRLYDDCLFGQEAWNRGGVMQLTFRKAVVENLSGLEFKDLKDFATEKGWTDYLFANKDFVKAYDAIDWNGIEMRSVFKEYYRKLTDYGAK